jgi:hypothetical protein
VLLYERTRNNFPGTTFCSGCSGASNEKDVCNLDATETACIASLCMMLLSSG